MGDNGAKILQLNSFKHELIQDASTVIYSSIHSFRKIKLFMTSSLRVGLSCEIGNSSMIWYVCDCVFGAQGYYAMFEVRLRNFGMVSLCPPLVSIIYLHININGEWRRPKGPRR